MTGNRLNALCYSMMYYKCMYACSDATTKLEIDKLVITITLNQRYAKTASGPYPMTLATRSMVNSFLMHFDMECEIFEFGTPY